MSSASASFISLMWLHSNSSMDEKKRQVHQGYHLEKNINPVVASSNHPIALRRRLALLALFRAISFRSLRAASLRFVNSWLANRLGNVFCVVVGKVSWRAVVADGEVLGADAVSDAVGAVLGCAANIGGALPDQLLGDVSIYPTTFYTPSKRLKAHTEK